MVETSILRYGCACTGFKVEPQDRMEKVHSEIDTLWQVSSHNLSLGACPFIILSKLCSTGFPYCQSEKCHAGLFS